MTNRLSALASELVKAGLNKRAGAIPALFVAGCSGSWEAKLNTPPCAQSDEGSESERELGKMLGTVATVPSKLREAYNVKHLASQGGVIHVDARLPVGRDRHTANPNGTPRPAVCLSLVTVDGVMITHRRQHGSGDGRSAIHPALWSG